MQAYNSSMGFMVIIALVLVIISLRRGFPPGVIGV